MKNLKLAFLALLLVATGFTSCKKEKDETSDGKKNVKVTFSVSSSFNKASGHDFSLNVGGAVISNSNSSSRFIDWKVNGENSVGTITTLGSDFVNGGKNNVLIESAEAVSTGSLTISAFALRDTAPFTITYKLEVAGKIVDEKSVVVNPDADVFSKNYTF